MSYRPLYAAGALLLAGSLSVYAQAQDTERLEKPNTNINQQQPPSDAGQNKGQSQDSKAERPASGERSQGSQANQREKVENPDAQRNDRVENDGKQSGDRKERSSAGTEAGSDQKNQRAEKSGEGGGKRAKQREASRKLQPQHKTVIKETIVKRNVRPAQVNFSINVGTVVPRSVVLYDLPPTIIEVAPDYSGYKYILADDDTILVIDPETWEIVDVIDV